MFVGNWGIRVWFSTRGPHTKSFFPSFLLTRLLSLIIVVYSTSTDSHHSKVFHGPLYYFVNLFNFIFLLSQGKLR
jgi:hypothetical protein